MKNKYIFSLHKEWKLLSSAVAVFAVILVIAVLAINKTMVPGDVDASTNEFDAPDKTQQNLKILVVELNPTLRSVAGQPKAADYIYPSEAPNQMHAIVDEAVSDLQWASAGYLNITTTWQTLDEFPKYKKTIQLPDGTSANSFNESNYLLGANGQSGIAGYSNLSNGGWLGQLSTGDFDYEYLIERLNLVERKNNGEFDQVWLVGIEPTYAYETMMVGKNPYWINGASVTANCGEFVIAGANPWRRDAFLHAMGHSYEQIMGRIYTSRFNSYGGDSARGSINISTREQYLSLNLWERFTLNSYVNAGSIQGVGTVHHPFNADLVDYDYNNAQIVETTYQEWGNGISNMVGNTTSMNRAVWQSAPYNDGGPDLTGGRYYMRFWLHRFPRETGYTSDGYLKNWWKYILSLRHVKTATVLNPEIDLGKGQEVSLNYRVTYVPNSTENKTLNKKYDNVTISNSNVVEVKNGKLYTKNVGQSTITVYIEGEPLEWTVRVAKPTQTVSFSENSITKTEGDSAFTSVATSTGDGAITYASSNEDVATVDRNTGRVSIVGAGNTTITATAAATDSYAEGSASYLLTVENAPATDPQSGGSTDDGGDEQGGQNGGDNQDGQDDADGQDWQDEQGLEQADEEEAGDGEDTGLVDEVSILPDASSETNSSNTETRSRATSSTKTSVEAPNTGSVTSDESGNILAGYYAPTVFIAVATLLAYGRHRKKSHRKFD